MTTTNTVENGAGSPASQPVTTPEGEANKQPTAEMQPPGKKAAPQGASLHINDVGDKIFNNANTIFNNAKFYNRERRELSKAEDAGLLADTPYADEKDMLDHWFSVLINKRILVIHSLDYSILSYYANVLCKMALNDNNERQARSLSIDTTADDRVTIHDYENRFLNPDEVKGPQILLINDRSDYESHENPPFFQSMIDAGNAADSLKNRMAKNDHMVIYKFGAHGSEQAYDKNLAKWNFGQVWRIEYFPTVLFIKYFPVRAKAEQYQNTITEQRNNKKWHNEFRHFVRELSEALKTNRLEQLIKIKSEQDYVLPIFNDVSVEVQQLFEKHPLNPFVLLVAAYFEDVNLGEFNIIITLLLRQHDAQIYKEDSKGLTARKSRLAQWQKNSDQVIRNCALAYQGTGNGIARIQFINPATRTHVLECFRNHYALFVLRQSEVLVDSGYWLASELNEGCIKSLTMLVSHIADNNREVLISAFIRKSLSALEHEWQRYNSANSKITLIERHLAGIKVKIEKENLSYEDLFAETQQLQEDGNISEEELRALYLSIIYEGSSFDENSPLQIFRDALNRSIEHGEARKEILINERELAAQVYFKILDRVIDYLQALMKKPSIRRFALDCITGEIFNEKNTFGGFAVVSKLHQEYLDDSLAILKKFLDSQRKRLREQSFQALVNLIRLNPETLFTISTWRPSPQTTLTTLKSVSWVQNSAAAVIAEIFYEGLSKLDFVTDHSFSLICLPNTRLEEQQGAWGTENVPLPIFAWLQKNPETWRERLTVLLDWLFDPLTIAANLRRSQGHYAIAGFEVHQKTMLSYIAWMINIWSQVLLGKQAQHVPDLNTDMVKFILQYVAQHENNMIRNEVRASLGMQPAAYSDYIIYLKNDNKDYQPYIRQRAFIRDLIEQFDTLRQESDQLVQP